MLALHRSIVNFGNCYSEIIYRSDAISDAQRCYKVTEDIKMTDR